MKNLSEIIYTGIGHCGEWIQIAAFIRQKGKNANGWKPKRPNKRGRPKNYKPYKKNKVIDY